MNRIISFAKARPYALAALVLSSLLIWFLGDAVSIYGRAILERPVKRLLLIILVWLIFIIVILLTRIRRRMTEREFTRNLVAGEAHATSEEKLIQESFSKAVVALQEDFSRRHGRWGARNSVYQLPWYILIGQPGSGKTTTLENSKLHFLLAEKLGRKTFQGVGGTRLCDWMFTDQAVLIDTAGRFVSQDSDKDKDSASWSGFLRSLKKYRKLQPLNGVIAVFSASDLMDEKRRPEIISNLALRLREINTELSHRLPVYIVINKMDLVQGFSEFFALLDQDARDRVWGITSPEQAGGSRSLPAAFVDSELAVLVEKLIALRLTRMEQEQNLATRAAILLFPEQFRLLTQSVKSVYTALSGEGSVAGDMLLRGIYFTSATRHGNAIDKVLEKLGLKKTVAPTGAVATGRSYFINDLLTKVIFQEAGMVSETPARVASRKRYLALSCVIPMLFLMVFSVVWTVSWFKSKKLLQELESRYELVLASKARLDPSSIDSVNDYLLSLNQLGLLAVEMNRSLPMSGFGINALSEYASQVEYAYRNSLRTAFGRLLYADLESRLRQGGENRYQLLKTYLAIADRQPVNEEAIATILTDRILAPRMQAIDQKKRTSLIGHIRMLLEDRPLISREQLDEGIIRDARIALKDGGLVDVAYSVLLERSGGKSPDFISTDAPGPSAGVVFSQGDGKSFTVAIPGVYTRSAYNRITDKELDEAIDALDEDMQWVLGDSAPRDDGSDTRAQLKKQVLEKYLTEYAGVWAKYSGNMALVRMGSLGDAIQQTKILTGPENILLKMLEAIVAETSLTREPVAQGKVQQIKSTVFSMNSDPVILKLTQETVDRTFLPLYELLYMPEKKADQDALFALFKKIETQLYLLDEAAKRAQPVPDTAALMVEIRSFADKYPAPVSGILQSYYAMLGQFSKGVIKQGMSNELAGGVSGLCRQVITNRYPFSKGVREDVQFVDFGKLFAPGTGVIPAFFDKNVKPYVDMSGGTWRQLAGTENTLAISSDSLANFQKADAIKNGFFQNGGVLPYFSFDLRWVQVPPEMILQQARLEVDGQSMPLQNNLTQHFNWPALPGGNRVRISVDGLSTKLDFQGAWAILRLFDAGNPSYLDSGRLVRLTWNLPEGALTAEARANGLFHPFIPQTLGGFRCPDKL